MQSASFAQHRRANAERLRAVSLPASDAFLRLHGIERIPGRDYRLTIASLAAYEEKWSSFLLEYVTPEGVGFNLTTRRFDLATIDSPRLIVASIHDVEPADDRSSPVHSHQVKSLRLARGPIPTLADAIQQAIRRQKQVRARATGHLRNEPDVEQPCRLLESRWYVNLPVQTVIEFYAA